MVVKPDSNVIIPTLLANSTLDRATVEAIAGGKRPFPNYADIPLTPQRRLLHEVIVQAVTERKINVDPTSSYDKQLEAVLLKATSAPEYHALANKGTFSQHDISALLDTVGLKKLPVVEGNQRVTILMATAGPATGKTDLIALLAKENPQIYQNAAMVNSDDYKPLLARPREYGQSYANAAHTESAFLSDKIMARLSQKIDSGRAPHVVLDVVTLNDQRIAFTKKSGQLIVAAGTLPPEMALERSEKRAKDTGRAVPPEVVLAGTKVVSETTPRIFEHQNVKMELFDTNVPHGTAPKRVAEWIPGIATLSIRQPDTFIDFIERQNLNIKANGPAEFYNPQDRTPQRIADGLKAYTDKGVTLAFLDDRGNLAMSVSREGVERIGSLSSHRGNNFFPQLAVATTILLAGHDVARTRPQADEHAATNEHKAPVKTAPVYGATISAAVGGALSVRGLVDAAQPGSSVRRDIDVGGAQGAFGGARVATQATDAVISVAATVEGTNRYLSRGSAATVGVANKLADLGPAGKLASRAALPLAVGAGVFEAGAGIMEKNPERVAGAIGSTGGGIAGGIAAGAAAGATWGAIGGSPTEPGALVTAGLGALGGALLGAAVGEEKAKQMLTGAVDKLMKAFDDDNKPVQQGTMSPDMLRALSAAKNSTLSASIRCDAPPATPQTPVSQAVPKQQVQGAAACR